MSKKKKRRKKRVPALKKPLLRKVLFSLYIGLIILFYFFLGSFYCEIQNQYIFSDTQVLYYSSSSYSAAFILPCFILGLILFTLGLAIYESDYTFKTIRMKIFHKDKKVLTEKQMQLKRRDRKIMLLIYGIVVAFFALIVSFPFLFLNKRVEIRQDTVVYYNLFGSLKNTISLEAVEEINISVHLRAGRGDYDYLKYELVFRGGQHLRSKSWDSFESGGYRDGYYSIMELHEQVKDHAIVTVEGLEKLDLFISDPELEEALYRCFSD